jgi:hypothetical protein
MPGCRRGTDPPLTPLALRSPALAIRQTLCHRSRRASPDACPSRTRAERGRPTLLHRGGCTECYRFSYTRSTPLRCGCRSDRTRSYRSRRVVGPCIAWRPSSPAAAIDGCGHRLARFTAFFATFFTRLGAGASSDGIFHDPVEHALREHRCKLVVVTHRRFPLSGTRSERSPST